VLAFAHRAGATTHDVSVLLMNGDPATTRPLLTTPADDHSPEFSPDGRWIAYVSDESGRPEVYVRPYPGSGAKQQVSTNRGMQPAWSPTRRELFYTEPDPAGLPKMMTVAVALEPTFTAGPPRMLFQGRFQIGSPIRAYDVTADGNRFLMTQVTDRPPEPPITRILLAQHWFEELRRLTRSQ
jgi:eukaryotic-like serine/threonine-protein kinase